MKVLVALLHDPLTCGQWEELLYDGTFKTRCVESIDLAIDEIDLEGYCALIIDGDPPGFDVREACRRVRGHGFDEPIFVLTDDDGQIVETLDSGADDVIVKPVSSEEMLARLRAAIRRCGPAEDGKTLHFEDLEVDLVRWNVTRDGQNINMTSQEMGLLAYFIRNPRRVIDRKEIGENVWEKHFDASSNVIDVYISRLRRKIDKPFDKSYLHTIVGEGYMLTDTPPGTTNAAD